MLSAARARLFHHTSDRPTTCIVTTSFCCTTFLAGTGLMVWVWGKYIWPAMEEAGMNETKKIVASAFASGPLSLTVGVIGSLGLTALAALCYYRCIKPCLNDPFEVVPPQEQGLITAVDVSDVTVSEEVKRTFRV